MSQSERCEHLFQQVRKKGVKEIVLNEDQNDAEKKMKTRKKEKQFFVVLGEKVKW